MPIWVGVGGTPESFVRAGALGLPLMVAIIGGDPRQFAPLIELYRRAGDKAGHAPQKLKVGLHMIGFVAETTQEAADVFFPGSAKAFTEIGKERGWRPTTRAQYDRLRGRDGALIIGDPTTVTEKLLRYNAIFGGIARLNFQMTVATLAHGDMMKAIRLLGKQVAPHVRQALEETSVA